MRTRYITAEEVAKIASMLKPTVQRLWLLMNDTGLRVSDAVKLKYGDIDKKGCIHYIAKKTGKTGIIRLSGEVLAIIGSGNDDDYVFRSSKSPEKHIHRSTVFKHIKKACDLCGVDPDGVAPHSARKAFAVNDFRENGLGKTMHDLQHSSPATTLFYALSDNPIPQIFAQLRVIKQNLDWHYELIEELRDICDMLFEKIGDVEAPIDVKLSE